MKLNNQIKYLINGIILLILGVFSVTFLPLLIKFHIERYVYLQIEFFFLCCASIFYLFSPKYYKIQILTILWAVLYYLLFVKFI